MLRRATQHLLRSRGLKIKRTAEPARPSDRLPDVDDETWAMIMRVRGETMTSVERLNAVIEAVRYVDRHGLPGALVECGVWRGGSSMAAALAHLEAGAPTRELHLYDTFKGMPPPGEVDVEHCGRTAAEVLAVEPRESSDVWAVAARDVVAANVRSTGYPEHLIVMVEGRVEETVPATVPSGIAVLRLDTDWYESTRHELEHLVPLVVPGGVLIVDDYGHWQGARRAVDEWLSSIGRPVLLNRTDYTGRMAVLP